MFSAMNTILARVLIIVCASQTANCAISVHPYMRYRCIACFASMIIQIVDTSYRIGHWLEARFMAAKEFSAKLTIVIYFLICMLAFV